jgi:glucans biosynthesis protein C
MQRLDASQRQRYLDWLRVLAVALLVPFHTGMMFTFWPFHLNNDTRSMAIQTFNEFLNVWHMPLFFFLSGAGTWYALGFRSGGVYMKERLKRLFIPLIFGMFVIVPPQVYVERLYKGQFHGSFLAFYPHVFNGPYPQGNLSWHHLWFMLYLFLHSLMALPLFLYLRGERGRRAHERIAAFFSGRASVYRIMIPFILLQLAFRSQWPNGDQNLFGDLDNFFLHGLAFVCGYVLCAAPRFWDTALKNRWGSLGGGVLCFACVTAWHISLGEAYFERHLAAAVASLVVHGAATWFWLLALLGFAKKQLDFTNRFLKYAVEAALPFYILHQTVILILAYFVLPRPWGIAAKYSLIIAAAFAGTLIIYDLCVKRFAITRFLFGMRPKVKA